MAADYVGARLRITTEEGSYEGTVHMIDPVRRKLTLTKVISCTKGKPPKSLHGFHNFYGHELNNLEILDNKHGVEMYPTPDSRNTSINSSVSQVSSLSSSLPPSNCTARIPSIAKERSSSHFPQTTNQSNAQASVFRSALQGAGLQFKKPTQPPGVVTKDASDEGTALLNRPPIAAEEYLKNDFYLDDEEELSPHLPPKTVILSENNDRFHNAIKNINSQRVVGLSCEGVNLGRHGQVCWLVIGSRHFTYMFDIMSLGDTSFEDGLGEILENGNILKVTHDCRQMSDALYHQYSIKLINVFDTQVADILIYKQEKGGNLPKTVNGLVGCLYEYLNLSPEQCHFQKVRINNMQKDEAIWSRRPLPQQVTESAAKRVMYLRELRLAQMERMMAEFISGVNIYLGVVRDAKDYKVNDKRHLNKSRQVPHLFQELCKTYRRQRVRKYDDDFADDTREDERGQPRGNAWHEGEDFTDTYRNMHGHIKEQSMQPLPGWQDPSGDEGRGNTGTVPDIGTHNSGCSQLGRNTGVVADTEYSQTIPGSWEKDTQNTGHGDVVTGYSQDKQPLPGRPYGVNDRGVVPGQQIPYGVNNRVTVPGQQTPYGANDRVTVPGQQIPYGVNDRGTVPGQQTPYGVNNRVTVPGQQTPYGVNDRGVVPGQQIPYGVSDRGTNIETNGMYNTRDSHRIEQDNAFDFKFSGFEDKLSSDIQRVDITKDPSYSGHSQGFGKESVNNVSTTFNARNGPPGSSRQDTNSLMNPGFGDRNMTHNTRHNTRNTSNLPIFSEEDFPPLSDSDSSNSGFSFSPPRPKQPTTSSRDETRRPPALNFDSRPQYPTVSPDSRVIPGNTQHVEPFVGRGRASLFQHMSSIPHARLPHMDDDTSRRPQHTVGGLDRYSFPSDNELLATSEVTRVHESAGSIRGGTVVRVRQT